MNTAKQIINKGAEAEIFKHRNTIIKFRPEKKYRNEQIDLQLRKFRTNRETKVLQKLAELNVPAPQLVGQDSEFMLKNNIDPKFSINMNFIEGNQLKTILSADNFKSYAMQVGDIVAKMHNNDIVHGDLTTSNMLVNDDKVFLIDFGLSNFSTKVEDKAVDLHLLKEALNSKHPLFADKLFNDIVDKYKECYPGAIDVLKRFEQVELRGKNKH